MPLAIRLLRQTRQKNEIMLLQMEVETEQAQWVDLNRQFHNALDNLAQTQQLRLILQRLSDLSAIYVNLSFAVVPLQKEASEQEHRAIYQAYRERDADAAITLTLQHLEVTLEAARRAIAQKAETSIYGSSV